MAKRVRTLDGDNIKPDALQTAFRVYDFEKVSVRNGPDAAEETQAEVTVCRPEFISCGSTCIGFLLIDAKRAREPHCPLTSLLLMADGFWQAAAEPGGRQKPDADANSSKGTESQGQQHDYVYDIYCVKECPADDIPGADQKVVPGAPVIQVISEAMCSALHPGHAVAHQ